MRIELSNSTKPAQGNRVIYVSLCLVHSRVNSLRNSDLSVLDSCTVVWELTNHVLELVTLIQEDPEFLLCTQGSSEQLWVSYPVASRLCIAVFNPQFVWLSRFHATEFKIPYILSSLNRYCQSRSWRDLHLGFSCWHRHKTSLLQYHAHLDDP